MYPLSPTTVLDNKSHLQAFRHFWVFAAEQRCVITYNIDTRRLIALPIIVTLNDGSKAAKSTPCLLPEFGTIAKVETNDPGYWQVTIELAENSVHRQVFIRDQRIYVRQRAVCQGNNSTFGATMQALNDAQSAHRLGRSVFEWLFSLPSLEGLDRAERALVLPPDSASTVYRSIRGTVIDDRVVLETLCLETGRSEYLWNVRLLLAWAKSSSRGNGQWGWIGGEVVGALKARLILRKRALNAQ